MRRAAIAIGLATLAVAGPAAAQAPAQLPWALTTCLQNVRDFRAAQQAFEGAGYGYELEDFGIGPSGVIHWYTSPDGGVTVAIGGDRAGGACRISPEGVTVAQATPYARSAAEQLLGVSFTPGSPSGAADGCSFWARASGMVVHVATGSQGQDPMCDGGAPAQIMINVTKG